MVSKASLCHHCSTCKQDGHHHLYERKESRSEARVTLQRPIERTCKHCQAPDVYGIYIQNWSKRRSVCPSSSKKHEIDRKLTQSHAHANIRILDHLRKLIKRNLPISILVSFHDRLVDNLYTHQRKTLAIITRVHNPHNFHSTFGNPDCQHPGSQQVLTCCS